MLGYCSPVLPATKFWDMGWVRGFKHLQEILTLLNSSMCHCYCKKDCTGRDNKVSNSGICNFLNEIEQYFNQSDAIMLK